VRRPRRRLAIAAGATAAAITVIGVPAAAFGLTGALGHGPAANAPMSTIKYHTGNAAKITGSAATSGIKSAASAASTDYHAYVALAGAYSIAEVDVASDTILADSISADSPEGVAVTPDGATVYVAETGQYQVIAVNASTGTETPITVGPYPQDVAVSPDGSQVYATVTGSDSGPGSSDVVAVISTATNKVTGDITVGPAPRQVVFSPDGSRAYVTDMNSDSVSVLATATRHTVATVPVGRLPGSVAVTPDGSQVWVGNNLTGNISVINPATDTVSATISGGSGTATLLAAPLGIAFTKAG
jgi:YVTN family beta-propeller protein